MLKKAEEFMEDYSSEDAAQSEEEALKERTTFIKAVQYLKNE